MPGLGPGDSADPNGDRTGKEVSMAEVRGHVAGPNDEHEVLFYGLSTCVWCKRTRQFLEEEGVRFDFVYVDLLKGEEREQVLREVRRFNPSTSFPTTVIDGVKVVVGLRKEALKEVLGL
jgi:glutaredoxin-like protein NrdH